MKTDAKRRREHRCASRQNAVPGTANSRFAMLEIFEEKYKY